MHKTRLFCFLLLFVSIGISAQEEVLRKIQTQAIEAENGDTIYLPEGRFTFNRSISIDDKTDLVLIGKGSDKTILSFKEQIDGAEGLKINRCKNISLLNFTIQDAKGDCIKILNTENLLMRNVKTEWTGKPSKKNGAYGIYPVSCKGVTIESCTAIGASDAGIYVGQSYNVVVKNCLAKYNVAGIEIENCVDAEVYNNLATENTGGILVFDLPELPLKRGRNIKVHHNKVIANNYKNFAPKGNIVGEVPPGTGIMILSSENVEIYANEISGNRTASVSVISYYISERTWNDAAYNPFSINVKIYDNTIQKSKKGPSTQTRVGLLIWFKFKKKVPSILYDGIIDDKMKGKGPAGNENEICIYGNSDESFANLDAANNFKGLNRDITKYRCK